MLRYWQGIEVSQLTVLLYQFHISALKKKARIHIKFSLSPPCARVKNPPLNPLHLWPCLPAYLPVYSNGSPRYF